MAEADNAILGAEFQQELYDHLWKLAKETAVLVLKVANRAGYLPMTDAPKGLAAQVAAGLPNMQAIIAQGGPQTNRQQKFMRDWIAARSRLNVNGNS